MYYRNAIRDAGAFYYLVGKSDALPAMLLLLIRNTVAFQLALVSFTDRPLIGDEYIMPFLFRQYGCAYAAFTGSEDYDHFIVMLLYC